MINWWYFSNSSIDKVLTKTISLILLHHFILYDLVFCRFMVLICHHQLLLFHLCGNHLLLLLLLLSFNCCLHILCLKTIWVLFLLLSVRWFHRLTVEFGRRLRGTLLFNNWRYLSSPCCCLLELFEDFLFHGCEVCLKRLLHAHAACYVHFSAWSSVENWLIWGWPLQVARSSLSLQMATRLRMRGFAVFPEVHKVVVVQFLDIFKFERQWNFFVVPSLASLLNTAVTSSFIFYQGLFTHIDTEGRWCDVCSGARCKASWDKDFTGIITKAWGLSWLGHW